MYFAATLIIIVIFYLVRKPVRAFAAWLLGKFAAIPASLNKKVVSTLVRLVILNWYTFLMVILLWVLLFKTDVGKDIINSYLGNLKRLVPFWKFFSLFSLFLSLFLMSLTIWIIPFFVYSEETIDSTKKNAEPFWLATKLLAFIAMLPFLVVTNAFLAYADLFSGWKTAGTVLVNGLSFLLFLLLGFAFEKIKPVVLPRRFLRVLLAIREKINNPYGFILVKIFFWITFTLLLYLAINYFLETKAVLVSAFIFASSVVVFRLLFYTPGTGRIDPTRLVCKMLGNRNRKSSRMLYWFVFIMLAVITLYYYLVPSLEATNPLYILLVVFSLFIIYLDFWRNVFRNYKGILRVTALLANIVFLVLPFRARHKQFRIPFTASAALEGNRVWLEEGIENRLRYINAKDSTGSIYIICAMGGGSRAGYIAAGVLRQLDSIDKNLWDHTLCYSTISGGSVGVYSYIRGKENGCLKDSSYLPCIYQKNYNGGGVFGLLAGDAMETFFGNIIIQPKRLIDGENPSSGYFDRNVRIRQEYDYTMDQATRGTSDLDYWKKTFYPWFYKLPAPDLFQTYFAAKGNNIPVQLVNTFEISSGRRTVLSPFPVRDTNFFLNTVLPLQDTSYDKDPLHKDIRYREAVNLSELFPIISAASHIGKSNTQFVDGGYYENYGLSTALDLFWYLQKAKPADTGRIKIILIKNSLQEAKPSPEQPQLLAPLVGAINSPFTGHANHMLEETRRVMDSSHLFVIKFDGEGKKVPLTRSLTATHIEIMNSFIQDLWYYPGLIPFLKLKGK